MDFELSYLIEQINLRDSIKEKEERLQELKDNMSAIGISHEATKEDITKLKLELKRFKSIKNMIFNKREIKKQEDYINTRITQLTEIAKKLDSIMKQVNDLEKQLLVEKSNYKIDIPSSIIEQDGSIVITDIKDDVERKLTSNKELLFHCTDFFPKNKTILSNYDGNKPYDTTLEYQGVSKNVHFINHRHTCHFTINNTVKAHENGDWSNTKYVIIEPIDSHKNKLIKNKGSVSDTWTYGSVKLSEQAILLVSEEEYNNIPKEELSNYKVIKYRGDRDTCVENLLHLFGIKPEEIAKDNSHFRSEYMDSEILLDERHKAINYLKDNSWDGKKEMTFSEQELFTLYEIAISNMNECLSRERIPIPASFYKQTSETDTIETFNDFMIGYGIVKTDTGYTIKDDDQLFSDFERIQRIKDNSKSSGDGLDQIKGLYDFDEFEKIYQRYNEVKEQKEMKELINDDINSTYNDQVIKFNNPELKAFIINQLKDIEKEEYHLYFLDDSCVIRKPISESEYSIEHLKALNLKVELDAELYGEETTYNLGEGDVSENIYAENPRELITKVYEFINKVESTRINIKKEEENKQL